MAATVVVTMAATVAVAVTMPKSTRSGRKVGEEGGGMHNNIGVKEEAMRWRMLMTMTMVVVGHDDGDK